MARSVLQVRDAWRLEVRCRLIAVLHLSSFNVIPI